MTKPTIEPRLLPTRQEIRELLHAKVVRVVEEVLKEELTAMLGTELTSDNYLSRPR